MPALDHNILSCTGEKNPTSKSHWLVFKHQVHCLQSEPRLYNEDDDGMMAPTYFTVWLWELTA